MFDNVIDEKELGLNAGASYAEKAKSLFDSQLRTWELCRNGYKSLESVKMRRFDFDGFGVKVQFNPGRIVSSGAKVDPKSIKERKCFLCPANLPSDQKGLLWKNEYLILCNPFPIFPEHFTIPNIEHIPQCIENRFETMLDITKDLSPRYAVFYNGPKCGASAPDHFHFQAGIKNFMPVDKEYDRIKEKLGSKIYDGAKVKIYAVDKYLRFIIGMESADKAALTDKFNEFYAKYAKLSVHGEEPMMNIITYYEENLWKALIFPRGKHRPGQYFAEGEANILISPGSVDMGGVFITPQEKDFIKLTKDDVIDILAQAALPAGKFALLIEDLVR
jgi:hypothetical protein